SISGGRLTHSHKSIMAKIRARCVLLFFSTIPATTDISTLSLHDALPICQRESHHVLMNVHQLATLPSLLVTLGIFHHGASVACEDRKSTRLNSSHRTISYAVFCLKKKNSCCSFCHCYAYTYISTLQVYKC